jgi:geranylgeranyl reductase family protein
LKTAQLLDFDLSPAFEDEIRRGVCSYKGGSPVKVDFGEAVGWTVMRDKLDHLILQEASSSGAKVLDGQKVSGLEFLQDRVLVTTTLGDYTCSILVGADGANGMVARCANLPRPLSSAIAVEAEIQVSGEALESRRGCVHFDFGCTPRGYGWVFPKREVLSVGVGTFWGKATKLKASLSAWLDVLGLPSSPHTVRMRGHLVPLGGEARVLHGRRVVLAGDAAGLAEPMTGEGIYYAVRSAQIAADTVQKALLDDGSDLSAYSEQVNTELAGDLKYARLLAGLLYRLPALSFHLLVRSPTMQWGVANALCGRSNFKGLCRELVKSAPRVLFSGLR